MVKRTSPPASRSRWLSLFVPGSAEGFFLLEGSFAFPLLPRACSKGIFAGFFL